MARTAAEIQAEIIAAKDADSNLDVYDSPSDTALWRLWTWIFSLCQSKNEKYFDRHKAEVAAIIAAEKPHRVQWYAGMAKKFQFGDALVADQDYYNPINAANMIVAYAAAVELDNQVRIKVAKLASGVLAALSDTELAAFTAYMNRVRDAGVRLLCTSGTPDSLQLKLLVDYDALVLDATGARLDGGSTTPVKDRVNVFLENQPFNGLFVVNDLIADLRANVDGVVNIRVEVVQAQYGMLLYTAIVDEYTPDAGYMLLDDGYFDAEVTYAAHAPI